LVQQNVGYPGFSSINNNTWNNTLNFTLSNDSVIDIAFWETIAPARSYRPGINLLKITKSN